MIIEAVVCASLWLTIDAQSGHLHSAHFFVVGNTVVRLCAFLTIGWAIRRLVVSEQEKSALLRRSIEEVKVLRGILPICAVCKKIRDGEGDWLQMERYISEHSGAQFSHGYCPECAKAAIEEAGVVDTAPDGRSISVARTRCGVEYGTEAKTE